MRMNLTLVRGNLSAFKASEQNRLIGGKSVCSPTEARCPKKS